MAEAEKPAKEMKAELLEFMNKMSSGETPELENKMDPDLYEYARSYASSAMMAATFLGMEENPIDIMANIFLVGISIGIEVERTKPENEKMMTLNLQMGGDR